MHATGFTNCISYIYILLYIICGIPQRPSYTICKHLGNFLVFFSSKFYDFSQQHTNNLEWAVG